MPCYYIFTNVMLALFLCYCISCQSECNYWYDQVPKSPNNTICNINDGSTVYLACAVYYPCDNISIKWYRSRTEMNASDNVIRRNGECINSLADDKYLQINPTIGGTTNNNNFERCCFASFLLLIHYFNQNDNGNYWCQLVADNRVLQPSSYAYMSVSSALSTTNRRCLVGDLINNLSPASCADNNITNSAPSDRMVCTYMQGTSNSHLSQNDTDSTEIEMILNQSTISTVSYTMVPNSNEIRPPKSITSISTTIETNSLTTTLVSIGEENNNSMILYKAVIGILSLVIVTLLLITLFLAFSHFRLRMSLRQKQGTLQGVNINFELDQVDTQPQNAMSYYDQQVNSNFCEDAVTDQNCENCEKSPAFCVEEETLDCDTELYATIQENLDEAGHSIDVPTTCTTTEEVSAECDCQTSFKGIETYPSVSYSPLHRKSNAVLHTTECQTQHDRVISQNRLLFITEERDDIHHSQGYVEVLVLEIDESRNVGVEQTRNAQRSQSPEYMEITTEGNQGGINHGQEHEEHQYQSLDTSHVVHATITEIDSSLSGEVPDCNIHGDLQLTKARHMHSLPSLLEHFD